MKYQNDRHVQRYREVLQDLIVHVKIRSADNAVRLRLEVDRGHFFV